MEKRGDVKYLINSKLGKQGRQATGGEAARLLGVSTSANLKILHRIAEETGE